MSAVENAVRPGTSASWLKQHPLLAFSAIAYAFTFVPLIFVLLAQQMGLVSEDSPVFAVVPWVLPFGPFVAALIMSAVEGGRVAVGALLRRIVQWRVGVRWYLIALLGVPVVMLIGASIFYSGAPLRASAEQWQKVVVFWLPSVLVMAITTGLGEEPGWRGFALPRLQARHGPLVGTLILGVVWSFWHLPNVIMMGWDIQMWVVFVLATMVSSFVLTWVYNNTGGSILLAILLHGAQNTSSWVVRTLVPASTDFEIYLIYFLTFGVSVVVILAATQARLGYEREGIEETVLVPA